MATKDLTQQQSERERIKAWMDANGLTAASLAAATGDFYTGVYAMLEKEDRRISQGFKWRIRRAYGNAVADHLFPDEAPVAELA